MTQKVFDALCMAGAVLLVMGWVDWLWLFGVEDSKSYTWWAVMTYLAP